MTTQFNSEDSFNELVFENRNKEYGAYALRKSYGNTVARSLLISLTSIIFLMFCLYWFGKGIEKLPDLGANILPPVPDIRVIDITPPIEHPKEKIHPADPSPPKSESGNLIASDEKNKNNNKTNEESNISKTPNENGLDSINTDPVEPKKIDPPVEDNAAKYSVDVMPEFEGNVYQFIKSNLRYPQIAVENGTEGTVGLSFIIEKDGTIGEIKTLRNIGDGCTEEAIRVLRMMPKWKPGLNHGIPVRVIFTLPVKFRLGK